MKFKIKFKNRILFSIFVTLVFVFILYVLQYTTFDSYVMLLPLLAYIITLIKIYTYKVSYEIKNGKVIINDGRRCNEIYISEVIHIKRKTSLGIKGDLPGGGINEKYYIVTKNNIIEIDKSIRNEENKNLVDVLTRKYDRKIKDSIKLFE